MEMEMEIIKSDSVTATFLTVDQLETPKSDSDSIEVQNDNGNENIDEDLSIFLFDEDRRYNNRDMKYNFTALKWAAWLKLSPFGVDENSKSFPRFRKRHQKRWQNGVAFCWFALAVSRFCMNILSTTHFGMSQTGDENFHQMTVMIVFTICSGLLLYVMTFGLFLNAQNLAPFLFSIFKYLDAEKTGKKTRPRKSRSRFGRHTIKELLIIHLPFLVYSLSGMVPLLIAFDPSFPLLLVSLVQFEISWSFLFFAAFDSITFLYFYMIIHMGFYIFIGIHRMQEEAELSIKNLKADITPTLRENQNESESEKQKDERIRIKKALKNIGLLHIWTCFFNRSLSSVVYGCKLIALTASIFGGFGFIKMIQVENWSYAGIFILLFWEGIILYNLFFGRAFQVPEKIEELKAEIRKQAFKTLKSRPLGRKYVDKYLRSIPWLGVKDGVYKMERTTCVNFISFVTQQISGLVLAY